ncbi:TPA: acetyl-CoA carboxylase biotin carboxylase subunit [bacterium]|nr:acetyl-CoA carboxylase biotin carboxylase subunit [bacterium]
MFSKILIANRGEIALRIIRAAKEMGIKTVAIHSEADSTSLHISFADEVLCIGPEEPQESYLLASRIISAAEISGAEAIHPGYGFLSENPDFAEACRKHSITFIGPNPSSIRKLGDKIEARKLAKKIGVPIIQGSTKAISSYEEAKKQAEKIGFPILIKAAAGGGGKGIRVINNKEVFEDGIKIAQQEAKNAFGSDEVYVEKFIEKARHIEIQVLVDSFGNAVSLGERECSIQFRHQKLIEESPSSIIEEGLRKDMSRAAIKLAKAAGYTNAGTVEFLVDRKKKFYFLEVNSRIQVEHPVTETVTGIDIVKEQIRIADGEKLGILQKNISISGHAMEFRINAQDPDNNFAPSPGRITGLHIPGGIGVRVDTHIYADYEVPPYYDSLLAKLIIYGRNRDEVLIRAKRALEEFVIEGIKTTIPFHLKMLSDESFKKGNIHTQFLG